MVSPLPDMLSMLSIYTAILTLCIACKHEAFKMWYSLCLGTKLTRWSQEQKKMNPLEQALVCRWFVCRECFVPCNLHGVLLRYTHTKPQDPKHWTHCRFGMALMKWTNRQACSWCLVSFVYPPRHQALDKVKTTWRPNSVEQRAQ